MLNLKDDIILATNARTRAYVKYTPYTVGAVLKTKSGQSTCAERVAFLKAISEGETEFESILVIGGPKDEPAEQCLPCGYCRQFMSEFVEDDFKIYTVYDKKVEEYTLKELLPHSFKF